MKSMESKRQPPSNTKPKNSSYQPLRFSSIPLSSSSSSQHNITAPDTPNARLVAIQSTHTLGEAKSRRDLILCNKTIFTNYLGTGAAASNLVDEDSESLSLKRYPLLEDELKKEISYTINKYKKDFANYTTLELEDVRKYNIGKEFTLRLFYEEIGAPIKYYGFKLESSPAQSENRLFNYRAAKRIQEDLELINAEEYGTRLIQSFTSIISFSLLYNFISSTIAESLEFGKYAKYIPQIVFICVALLLTGGREMYLTRTINNATRKIQKLLVTQEGVKFDLDDLRVALLHATAIRVAAEETLMGKPQQEAKEIPKDSPRSLV
jgi:hypothetical protein